MTLVSSHQMQIRYVIINLSMRPLYRSLCIIIDLFLFFYGERNTLEIFVHHMTGLTLILVGEIPGLFLIFSGPGWIFPGPNSIRIASCLLQDTIPNKIYFILQLMLSGVYIALFKIAMLPNHSLTWMLYFTRHLCTVTDVILTH